MSINPPTQYATSGNLAARQRLWTTGRREPSFDLIAWVMDLIDDHTGAAGSVLDVGCGNGVYERALRARGHAGRVVAVDLSAGMLPHVVGAEKVQADVLHLPMPASSFDIVLAPHMLYHVPNVRDAAYELRRVLRPEGVCVAVTNSVANLLELRRLVEDAVGTGWQMVRPADRQFNLENGAELLGAAFDSVIRVDCLPGDLVVDDIDALVDYVASTADHYEAEVDRPWSEVVQRARELAAGVMQQHGEFRLTASVGAFVCR
jgi:SAM-dependent methyltransferase